MNAGKLLVLELNEFNKQLLFAVAEKYQYKNILRLKDLHESSTYTADTYDSGYLEPWVQWVSVHTGVDSQTHKIKHLGDTAFLKIPQIWEIWSENGVSCGVWGVLNGFRNHAANCKFFVPDPWTFEEPGYPKEVSWFVGLPRYLARHYLATHWFKVVVEAVKCFLFLLTWRTFLAMLKELPRVSKYFFQFKGAYFVGYSFVEYLATLRFVDYKKKFKTSHNILFVNLLAHAQHYYWKVGKDIENSELKYVCYFVDRILDVLFTNLEENEHLVIINALSQTQTDGDAPWILYRQIDHNQLLDAIKVPPRRVEACMTHDAHLFFENELDAGLAYNILTSAAIKNETLFQVDRYENDPLKLFYMIKFSDFVNPDDVFLCGNQQLIFFDYFKTVIKRTGKHNGAGSVFSTSPMFDKKVFNHHIGQVLKTI